MADSGVGDEVYDRYTAVYHKLLRQKHYRSIDSFIKRGEKVIEAYEEVEVEE